MLRAVAPRRLFGDSSARARGGDEVDELLHSAQQARLEVLVGAHRRQECAASPATSAWVSCGQPRASRVPCLMSVPRGTSGQRSRPTRVGLTACHTSTYGCPRTSTFSPPGISVTRWAIRDSLEPATRWSTRTPARRSGAGPKSAMTSSRLSTPSSMRTTTPSWRRSSPQTFSTSSASCLPSTQMREARATFGPLALNRVGTRGRQPSPGGAHRAGGRAPASHRRIQDHRTALDPEPRPQRETAAHTVTVLQDHDVLTARLLHRHRGTDEPGLPVLNHQTRRHRHVHRLRAHSARSRAVRIDRQDVPAVAVT